MKPIRRLRFLLSDRAALVLNARGQTDPKTRVRRLAAVSRASAVHLERSKHLGLSRCWNQAVSRRSQILRPVATNNRPAHLYRALHTTPAVGQPLFVTIM